MQKSRLTLIILSALLCGVGATALMRSEMPQMLAGSTDRMGSSIPTRIAQAPLWTPNETITGNVLAANFAQSQRDWKALDQYVSHISTVVEKDEFTRLRMMLLALSAGEYDRAITLASEVANTPIPKNSADADMLADGRNMAALIQMASAVRASDFEAAQKHMDSLSVPALRALLGHVLSSWLDVASGKKLDAQIQDAAFLSVFHKALAAEWAGQVDVATQIFDQLAATPITPEATQIIAAFHMRHGNVDKAKQVLSEGLARYPQDHDIKGVLAALEKNEPPPTRAEWVFHMQGATAGIAQALRDLAHYMSTEKSTDSALIFGQMGRLIRSDVPRLGLLIGSVYQEEGRSDAAREAFLAIPPDAPDYIDAQIKLSELDAKLGNNSAAVRSLEELLKKHASPRVAYALGEQHRMDKNYAAAIRAYDRALELSGGKADDGLWSIYFVRAMAHDELGDWQKSEADLKTALEYRPDNAHVLNYLGYSYADRGVNLEDAKIMIIKSLSQMPLDPYTIDSLGWVYFKQGDYPQALLFLERAVSLKPYDPVMNDHLGDLYAKTGRTLEANYQWRRALSYADAVRDSKLIDKVTEKLKNGLPEN